jgi:hypothetical protein
MNVSNSIFWRCQPLCARELRFAEATIYQAPPQGSHCTPATPEPWRTRVTSNITAKGDTTMLTMTMRFASRAERDAALETGMADGAAVGYDRLDAILASTASRK